MALAKSVEALIEEPYVDLLPSMRQMAFEIPVTSWRLSVDLMGIYKMMLTAPNDGDFRDTEYLFRGAVVREDIDLGLRELVAETDQDGDTG